MTFVSMGTVLLRKEIVDKIGGFDESFRVVEDGDLYLRVAREHGIGWSRQVWVSAPLSPGEHLRQLRPDLRG